MITLTVKYTSIRRILIHIIKYSNDKYSFELYFYLTSSPLIHKIKIYDEKNFKGSKLTRLGDRCITWDPRIKNLPTLITESPIFKIYLKEIPVII